MVTNANGCSSADSASVTIPEQLTSPAIATVTTPIIYTLNATALALTATTSETGLLWYTTASGGTGVTTAPIPNTSVAGITSYWVSSTNTNTCESSRVQILVTVSAPATHLNFDGVNDIVDFGTNTTNALAGSSFVTAEAWINIPNTTGTKNIVGNHINNGAQFNLRVINNRLQGFIGFGTYNVNSAAGTIVANTWQHVALVYNDTTLKLFINGVEVGSRVIPAAYSLPNSTVPYLIGASGYGDFFNGNIDEVRIWNVARTRTALSNSRNCELQGTETGLISYFKFNQGLDAIDNPTVISLDNAVSGGTNGTLSGFALTGITSNWLANSPVITDSILPVIATATTTDATCTENGAASISNYNSALTYVSTPTGATVGASGVITATAGTAYTFVATNANGCSSAASASVTIPQAFSARFVATPNTRLLCDSKTAADLMPAPSATIKWYSEAIGSSALATTTALATGNYYLTETSAGGCESARTLVAVTLTPSTDNVTPITVCQSYTWTNNGQTYTQSGLYTGTTINCITEKLNLTINPAPIGDTLATAIAVNSTNYSTIGNNLSSNCFTNTIGSSSPDVWYKVNLDGCTPTLSANTCAASNYDTRLRVFDEDGITQLANNDDSCGISSEILNLDVAGKSFVYLIVEGWGADEGNYSLTINKNSLTRAWYADSDADGFGNSMVSQMSCTQLAGFVLNNTDCDDANANKNPGKAEIAYNGIDDNCDGNLDEGFPLIISGLIGTTCGSTLANNFSTIHATQVSGATGYRFRVTNMVSNSVQIIDRVPFFWFQFNAVTDLTYNTQYKIEVMVQRAGIYLGYYGLPCFVNTPSTAGTSTTSSSLNPASCGVTLPSINTSIASNALSGVTGYRFRVTNTSDSSVQILDRTVQWFNMTMLSQWVYGQSYTIEVALKTTGTTYASYGSICTIATPAVPSIQTVCGTQIAKGYSNFGTIATSGATAYKFEVTNTLTSSVQTLIKTVHYLNFNELTGISPATVYSIKVAVKTAGNFSAFGTACLVSSPAAARESFAVDGTPSSLTENFKVLAMPNPFSYDFAIDMTSNTIDNVSIKIYDMIGKLIEAREVAFIDIKNVSIGENYPSGVYNLIVNQGENFKTLRMIKR